MNGLMDDDFAAPIEGDVFASAGSQRWLQILLNRAPDMLLAALRPTLKLDSQATIAWHSPLVADRFGEYHDGAALQRLGINALPQRTLADFWPRGGPRWDALGTTSNGEYVFVEAKAHVGELASAGCQAKPESASFHRIQQSLNQARQHFAPQSNADWSGKYYQYANRLAHHYLFRVVNGLPSHLFFLYFNNDAKMNGPKSALEWHTAIQKVHTALGLPPTLKQYDVHEIFVDVKLLSSLV